MLVAKRGFALCIALVCTAGCKLVNDQPEGSSPLLPVATSADEVTLEVFSAPAPLDDPKVAALWHAVDEQSLPHDLRITLARNGLRAGIVSAHVPGELAALLRVTDTPIPTDQRDSVPIDTEPGVLLRVLRPQPGKRNELIVSPVHKEISLLRSVDGEVEGKTYRKAEGRLMLKVFPRGDGRVRIDLVPELHHGDPRTQTTGSDGMFIWTTQREKKIFSELKISTTLAAGEMLLVTYLAGHPNSVGHHLFVRQQADKTIQRLWVLRVAQAGPDRAFIDWTTDESDPQQVPEKATDALAE